jgi:drug/metabolite transporter (DMT)-like permease
LWSTGFIVAKFGLPYAPPLTFLLLRCLARAAGAGAAGAAGKRAVAARAGIRTWRVAGLLLQAGYLAASGAPSSSACRPGCRR